MPELNADGEIVVDVKDLPPKKNGMPEDKLPADLCYEIETVDGTETICIHVSCSQQPFFVGQEYPEVPDKITLTIVSGTDADLNPTIPDFLCLLE